MKTKKRQRERLTLSVLELARELGISRALAYRAASGGEIPSVRVGRRLLIPRELLADFLRGRAAQKAEAGK